MLRNLVKALLLTAAILSAMLSGLPPSLDKAHAFVTAADRLETAGRISSSFLGPADNYGAPTGFYSCTEAMSRAYAIVAGSGCVLEGPAAAWTETEHFGADGKLVLGMHGVTCNITLVPCTIQTFINQANNGSPDYTQSNQALQVNYNPPGFGSVCSGWGCWTAAGTAYYTATLPSLSIPYVIAGYAKFTGSFTSFQTLLGDAGSTFAGHGNATNTLYSQDTGGAHSATAAATDNVAHSMVFRFADAGSNIWSDNSAGSGFTLTGSSSTSMGLVGANGSDGSTAAGWWIGIWPADVNSTQIGNQFTQDSGRF